jgi:hypothetical protein
MPFLTTKEFAKQKCFIIGFGSLDELVGAKIVGK